MGNKEVTKKGNKGSFEVVVHGGRYVYESDLALEVQAS